MKIWGFEFAKLTQFLLKENSSASCFFLRKTKLLRRLLVNYGRLFNVHWLSQLII